MITEDKILLKAQAQRKFPDPIAYRIHSVRSGLNFWPGNARSEL
jgi:hypothetical protein